VLASIDRSHERYLQQDAGQVGADWARFLASAVPGSDLVFDGERPSPTAQAYTCMFMISL
jgi:hypothetical protein